MYSLLVAIEILQRETMSVEDRFEAVLCGEEFISAPILREFARLCMEGVSPYNAGLFEGLYCTMSASDGAYAICLNAAWDAVDVLVDPKGVGYTCWEDWHPARRAALAAVREGQIKKLISFLQSKTVA